MCQLKALIQKNLIFIPKYAQKNNLSILYCTPEFILISGPSGDKNAKSNCHTEYGLMLEFKKQILPFQRKGYSLAFNIHPLDTLLYTKSDFRKIADNAIDSSILATVTTLRQLMHLHQSNCYLTILFSIMLTATMTSMIVKARRRGNPARASDEKFSETSEREILTA